MAEQRFCSQEDNEVCVITFDSDQEQFIFRVMSPMLYKFNVW